MECPPNSDDLIAACRLRYIASSHISSRAAPPQFFFPPFPPSHPHSLAVFSLHSRHSQGHNTDPFNWAPQEKKKKKHFLSIAGSPYSICPIRLCVQPSPALFGLLKWAIFYPLMLFPLFSSFASIGQARRINRLL